MLNRNDPDVQEVTRKLVRAGLPQERASSWTNLAIAERAYELGVKLGSTPKRNIRLSYAGESYWWKGAQTNFNEPLAKRCAARKEVASRLLADTGVGTNNVVFAAESMAQAWDWAKHVTPVVLKPHNGNQGKGVHVGVDSKEDFSTIFDDLASTHREVLVEQQHFGVEHRFLLIDYRVKAVTRRVPANVVGDGSSTISELIDAKNSNLGRIHIPIRKGKQEKKSLAQLGYNWDSIPPAGSVVYLRSNSNIHTGGDAVDATDEVTSEEITKVETASRAFPGLRLAGFDVLLPRGDSQTQSLCILEVNPSPMISMHHYPRKGQARDAAGAILEAMFPSLAQPS